jgi:hypothetical protein
VLIVAAVLHAPLLSAEMNRVVNGGFETGDFTGWTVVNSGLGQFSVLSGTTAPSSGSAIPAPPGGAFASVSDQPGPGAHILYQDVRMPTYTPIHFSVLLYYNNQADLWADNGTLSEVGDPNQQLRIDIMDPNAPVDDVGAGVWMNIIEPAGDDPFETGYQRITADLSAFAGQTVRLRFSEVSNQFFMNMAIDEVRVWSYVPIPVNHPLALLVLLLGTMFLAATTLRKVRSETSSPLGPDPWK